MYLSKKGVQKGKIFPFFCRKTPHRPEKKFQTESFFSSNMLHYPPSERPSRGVPP
nr:MAG TPA: hypothetical protein [Caudoviricetes sp.]